MAIKHWPKQERPVERLLKEGATVLSDAELLAILLRTGVPGCSAVDLARLLINETGSLCALFQTTQHSLTQYPGLGPTKYAQLQAVKELSKRLAKEDLSRPHAMSSSRKVGEYLCQRLGHYQREVFALLMLDTQHRLIGVEELFSGTIDSATVHPREVIKVALQKNAAAVILAHNHPSGIAEPSQNDKLLTENLTESLGVVGIRVLDHLVVGPTQWVSFADRGWMN